MEVIHVFIAHGPKCLQFQYEERIEDLERKLLQYERPGDNDLKEGERPHSHAVAIQRELDAVKGRQKKRVAEMEAEIQGYKKELDTLKAKQIGKKIILF